LIRLPAAQLSDKIVESIYLKGVNDAFDGEVILGEDRMKFSLELQ